MFTVSVITLPVTHFGMPVPSGGVFASIDRKIRFKLSESRAT